MTQNRNIDYPDFSQPLPEKAISYPDFSQPIETPKVKESATIDTIFGKVPKIKNVNEALQSLSLNFPHTPEENQKIRERLLGAGQEVANYPIKIANLMRNKPLPEFKFAPETEAAQRGAVAGDIASFFVPGLTASNTLKGLSYLPKVGKGFNAIRESLNQPSFINSLLNVGKTGVETGLYNAVHNPEDPRNAYLEGAGIGGGTQAAANLLTTQNPILKMLARLGVGAGIGYGVGHPYYGAAVATAIPQLGRLMGVGGKNAISSEMLEGLEPKDVMRSVLANQRLGTSITPAQASGNYVTSGLEGNLKRTPEGSQLGYRMEQAQQRQQNQAINNMLNKIYVPTPQSTAKIDSLYKQAYQMNVNPNVIDKIKSNPIMASAFSSVSRDPAFAHIPENNYEYMAEVDRALQRMKEGAEPNSAYQIGQVKNSYNNFLKQANPDYEKAVTEAQPKLVREEIERKFNRMDEDMTGKNFYNRFLNTKRNYQDILNETRNFPEAQEDIKNMRKAWKHLSNMKTVSQGEAQAKSGIADMRDQFKIIAKAIEKMSGAKRDVEGLKFIYSKDWEKSFDQIAHMKDQKMRNRAFLSLLGKMGIIGGLQ